MAKIIARQGNELTIQVKVTIEGSLLDAENMIQNACNEVGLLATEEALKNFDTDGSPLATGAIKWTAKPPSEKNIKPLMGSWRSPVIPIKPRKAARFGVHWKSVRASFEVAPRG